jgi:hypothetical protein
VLPETVEYLSVLEFARAIGKSPRSVQRYVSQGRLQHRKSPTGALLIPQAELRQFARRKVAARPEIVAAGGMRPVEGGKLSVVSSSEPQRPVPEETIDPITQSRVPRATLGVGVVPLVRHEETILRLGWTEGQLEMTRRLLKEANQRESELLKRLDEAELRAENETESRLAAQSRIRDLEARLRLWEDRR